MDINDALRRITAAEHKAAHAIDSLDQIRQRVESRLHTQLEEYDEQVRQKAREDGQRQWDELEEAVRQENEAALSDWQREHTEKARAQQEQIPLAVDEVLRQVWGLDP